MGQKDYHLMIVSPGYCQFGTLPGREHQRESDNLDKRLKYVSPGKELAKAFVSLHGCQLEHTVRPSARPGYRYMTEKGWMQKTAQGRRIAGVCQICESCKPELDANW